MAFTTAPGVREDPLSGFRFSVSIALATALTSSKALGGVVVVTSTSQINLGFKTVSGLEREVEPVEYREGNDGIGVRKLPGLVVHPNVTLERGISSSGDIAAWFSQVVQYDLSTTKSGSAVSTTATGSVAGKGGGTAIIPQPYTADVTISLLGRGDTAVRVWTLKDAWPTKLSWEDLDAESSDILISTLELAYAYMEA